MSRPRLLGSGSNPPRLTGPSSIQLQPYGPSRASRMVGILFFMAVGIGALWVGFSVLTGRIEPADPVRLATTPPAQFLGYATQPAPTPWTTPLVDDYVLSQDDRLSLEATRAAVQADLDRIGGEIAQADESRKLALLRRQQELELEREAIGNRLLAIQTEAEAARVTQEAERADAFLQLEARQTAIWTEAQAIVAAGNARATVRAQEIQADKDKADADLAASQAAVYRLAVWIAGTLFVLVMLILSGIAFVFGWPHMVRATMEAQARLQLLRARVAEATQATSESEGDSLLQEWDEAARRGASAAPPADGFGPPPNYPPVRNGGGRGPARNYGNSSRNYGNGSGNYGNSSGITEPPEGNSLGITGNERNSYGNYGNSEGIEAQQDNERERVVSALGHYLTAEQLAQLPLNSAQPPAWAVTVIRQMAADKVRRNNIAVLFGYSGRNYDNLRLALDGGVAAAETEDP